MGTTIKLKRSATQSLIPGTGSLALGELAVNTYDGVVYLKKSVASVESVVALDPAKLINGNSNIVVTANANVTITSKSNATLVITDTGANITGTANISGNANVGNLGTATAIITTGNITTINSGLMQNGNSNVTIAANSNVTVAANGSVRMTVAANGNVGIANSTPAHTLSVTGTINISGNANVGNLGTAQILASANITSPQLISNIAIGTAPLVVTSTTQVANLNVALAGSSTTAGTVTTAAQPNITSVGTLTGLSVNATITANTFTSNISIGTAPFTVTSTTQVANLNAAFAGNSVNLNNGTSNVVVTSSGNITIGSAGNAAVFTVAGVGANLTGNLTTTGIKTDNYYYANGSAITFGGVTFTASGTAPVSPKLGDEWYDTGSDILYLRSTDGTSTFWLDISSQGNSFVTVSATTGNITTINSGLLQNGNSNVTIAANGAVSVAANGSVRMTMAANGNIGIANIAPTHTLSVTGTMNISGNANVGNLGTATAIITTGNITTINSGLLQNGNSNVTITANSNVTIAVTAANSYTFATGSFAPSANATVQLGLTGARWSNIWGLASSAQYADLAERYSSDEIYDPGTVVVFGGSAEITVTNKDHDRRVAGVVSTAPGYLMNDNNEQDDLMIAVGLTGRVPTKVVGPVEKGDLIVTSNQPGIAMKMLDSSFNPGCVIGKSLEDHPDDTVKTIEVVVGRF